MSRDDVPDGALTPMPWAALRRFTPARIALGRAGVSLPTRAHLDFQQAHAEARDAVHRPLDLDALQDGLQAVGHAVLRADSAAPDRATYLQRPDLGRRLGEAGRTALSPGAAGAADATGTGPVDLAIVIADGLSALAAQRQALPLLAALCARLALDTPPWQLAPVVLARQARVALGDDIGAALGARLVLVLIGERPGLSSADSLGAYLTWQPRPGRTDAERNCVSNIRPAGLGFEAAAATLHHLLGEARRRGLTGVALKDDTPSQTLHADRHGVLPAAG